MKLALHRSITFWSGILVMAFICWAWWLSGKYVTQGTHPNGWVANETGNIQIGFAPSGTSIWSSLHQPLQIREWEQPLFPKPAFQRSATFGVVSVPHWLLLIAVAFPWSALMLWRAKRSKRTAESSSLLHDNAST